MESISPFISDNLSTDRNPRDRSICFQIISSDQDLLSEETRSIEPSCRCLTTKLFHKSLYVFPPFCMIPKVLSKARKDKVPIMILVTPAWPLQLWYPEAISMSMQQTNLLKERYLEKPKGRNPSPCPKQNFKISDMDSLKARLQREGVSREASNLIIKSRRSSSNSNYE